MHRQKLWKESYSLHCHCSEALPTISQLAIKLAHKALKDTKNNMVGSRKGEEMMKHSYHIEYLAREEWRRMKKNVSENIYD